MRTSWQLAALLVLVTCAPAEESSVAARPDAVVATSRTPGPIEPPADASKLCEGHNSFPPSEDGAPARRVAWSAWFSRESPESLEQEYSASLGTPSVKYEGCTVWRFPDEKPPIVLAICEPSAGGSWSTCSAPPTEARSIVMISTTARSE